MHVLPNGFMPIRHYGLLANRCRQTTLAQVRKILARPVKAEEAAETEVLQDDDLCPKCHRGHLMAIRVLNPIRTQRIMTPG